MQAIVKNRNLEYCRYYHGEQQNPYTDSFKSRAWIAEQFASECAFDYSKDFLSFVAAHISKREPYGYEPDVARYIAFFEHCSFEEKFEIARAYALGDALQLKKPRGCTIFESHRNAGYFTPYMIGDGLLLYNDGSVFVKNAVPESLGCLDLSQEGPFLCNQVYFYVGKFKETADAVKKLIKENWTAISVLPKKGDCLGITDGARSYFKFLTKRCGGYMYTYSEGGKAVMPFLNKIDNIFYWSNTPGGLETTTNVESFVENWSSLLDEIDADRTLTKVYAFVESNRFEEDCRHLDFAMASIEKWKRCHCDPRKKIEKPIEEQLAACADYRVLVNAILNRWRYYNHGNYDVKAELDTKWFRTAFKNLQDLFDSSREKVWNIFDKP